VDNVVILVVVVEPSLDNGDFLETSIDQRLWIIGTRETEIFVVASARNFDGRHRRVVRFVHSTGGPWIAVTVREDDVARTLDVIATEQNQCLLLARVDAELLLTIDRVLREIPWIRLEHVSHAIGADRQDHFGASLDEKKKLQLEIVDCK